MSIRQQVTTAALLGGSQPLLLEPSGSPLDSLLPALAKRDASQRVLDAMALVTAYEAAGGLPATAAQTPEPATPDARARCSSMSSGHLAILLTDRRGLLPEWLGLLHHSARRPPEELIPALLDAASSDKTLRERARTAAGPLGQWLAQFREEWSWVLQASLDEAAWETGTLDERLALLKQLRPADPARARQWVEATWSSESADTKRQTIEALAPLRSLDDEEFLESALNDRSIVVRRSAAEQLASLAGSKLSQRIFDRLAGRLQVKNTGLLGRTREIEVTPLESLDAAMTRDGIEKKPPSGSPLGERAWWTAQAIACIDPARWTRELALSPEDLLHAAKNGQWHDLLLEGWQTAAIRYQSHDWLRVLAKKARTADAGIFRAMAVADREAALLQLLKQDARTWLPLTVTYCQHAWSPPFTQAVLRALDQHRPTGATDPLGYYLKPLLRSAALLAAPEAASAPPDEIFGEFTDLVAFRRSMRQALTAHHQENR